MFVASESDTDSQVSFYIMFQSLPGASLGGSWSPARPASRHPGTPGNSESQLLPAGTPPRVDGKTADSLEEAFIQEHMLVRALASLGVRGVVLRKQFGAPGAAIRVSIISLARTCT